LFKQKRDNKQNIVLNNKIVVFCFRVKIIAKKIIVQKQITTIKEIFVV